MCFFGVIPYGEKKHINKNPPPPKSRDNPLKILFTCFFLYEFFFFFRSQKVWKTLSFLSFCFFLGGGIPCSFPLRGIPCFFRVFPFCSTDFGGQKDRVVLKILRVVNLLHVVNLLSHCDLLSRGPLCGTPFSLEFPTLFPLQEGSTAY